MYDGTHSFKNYFCAHCIIQVEDSSSCRWDYVIIRDGSNNEGGNLIGKFCGSKIPSKIVSPGNKLWIKFSSDGSITKKGFTATYKAIGMN